MVSFFNFNSDTVDIKINQRFFIIFNLFKKRKILSFGTYNPQNNLIMFFRNFRIENKYIKLSIYLKVFYGIDIQAIIFF